MFTKIRKTEGWGTRNSGGGRTVRTAEHSGGTYMCCPRKELLCDIYIPPHRAWRPYFPPRVGELHCCPDSVHYFARAASQTTRAPPWDGQGTPQRFLSGEERYTREPPLQQGRSQTFGNVVHEIRNIRCCGRSISFDLQAAGNDFSPGIPGMRFYDLHSTAKMFIG